MTVDKPTVALRDQVEAFIASCTGDTVAVSDLRLLAGGASQEVWSVDATVGSGEPLQLVMRRDMGGAITFVSLPRTLEFAIVDAAYRAGVPVPKPYFEPTTVAGKPAFFMQRMPGEAVGRRLVSDPSFAPARERLPEQLAAALAAIHRVDI